MPQERLEYRLVACAASGFVTRCLALKGPALFRGRSGVQLRWAHRTGGLCSVCRIMLCRKLESAGEFVLSLSVLIPTMAGSANVCRALQVVRPK